MDAIDTLNWDVTDPDSVPFEDLNLKFPPDGKLPTNLVYAYTIYKISKRETPEVQKFINEIAQRMRASIPKYGDLITRALTRPFKPFETETFCQLVKINLAAQMGGAGRPQRGMTPLLLVVVALTRNR